MAHSHNLGPRDRCIQESDYRQTDSRPLPQNDPHRIDYNAALNHKLNYVNRDYLPRSALERSFPVSKTPLQKNARLRYLANNPLRRVDENKIYRSDAAWIMHNHRRNPSLNLPQDQDMLSSDQLDAMLNQLNHQNHEVGDEDHFFIGQGVQGGIQGGGIQGGGVQKGGRNYVAIGTNNYRVDPDDDIHYGRREKLNDLDSLEVNKTIHNVANDETKYFVQRDQLRKAALQEQRRMRNMPDSNEFAAMPLQSAIDNHVAGVQHAINQRPENRVSREIARRSALIRPESDDAIEFDANDQGPEQHDFEIPHANPQNRNDEKEDEKEDIPDRIRVHAPNFRNPQVNPVQAVRRKRKGWSGKSGRYPSKYMSIKGRGELDNFWESMKKSRYQKLKNQFIQ